MQWTALFTTTCWHLLAINTRIILGLMCIWYAMHILNKTVTITRISCRWQTRATRYSTANVLETNKIDPSRDKLATELRWQRFATKVANFQLLHLHLTCPICICRIRSGWTRLSFADIFGIRKLSMGYGVRCLRDSTFSRLSRTPTCDRQTDGRTDGQTDRQTDRHTTTANTAVTRVAQ